MAKKCPFTIIIDTREQCPYDFPFSKRQCLPSGDYSINGYEQHIAIERKTKQDIYQSVSKGRKRFKKEVERLATYKYAAIVIESSLDNLLIPPPYTELSPRVVINTLLSWSIKYRLHVFFASDRDHARAIVYRLLEKFWLNRVELINGKCVG